MVKKESGVRVTAGVASFQMALLYLLVCVVYILVSRFNSEGKREVRNTQREREETQREREETEKERKKVNSPGYPECNRSEEVIAAIPFMAYGLDLYRAIALAAPRRVSF